MRTQSFYDWLTMEVATVRLALIGAYEAKDRILYVEAPKLRKQYMEVIGVYEEPVLQAELEVSLLRRKAEMIRIALNRRQAVDLGAIDAQLEEEKQKQVADLESADKTLNELPELDENQARTLQRQYREITGDFHPAMNSDMTETQKELYQKAVEAYKMQDAEAMKLIYDMLYQPVGRSGYEIAPVDSEDTDEKRRQEYRKIASELTTDYRLAKKLYDAFVPLEEDHIMLDLLEQYGKQRKEVEAEIEQIRAGFPFNAVPTLNDRAKTEEYLAELRLRASRCKEERKELETQIASMTEVQRNG